MNKTLPIIGGILHGKTLSADITTFHQPILPKSGPMTYEIYDRASAIRKDGVKHLFVLRGMDQDQAMRLAAEISE